MRRPSTRDAGAPAATTVGVATLLIGGALLAAPTRLGPVLGLADRRGTQLVGALDLALVPGLLAGRPRWPWLAARAALNVATAGYALSQTTSDAGLTTRARAFALALSAATVADTRTAATARRSGAHGALR